MTLLLEREHSFDKPLAPYYGWEALTFRAFAETYGYLAKYMPKETLETRVDCNDKAFLVNLQAAAQFNEYMLQHQQCGNSLKTTKTVAPAKSKRKKGQ